jgi:hypothetical protein
VVVGMAFRHLCLTVQPLKSDWGQFEQCGCWY